MMAVQAQYPSNILPDYRNRYTHTHTYTHLFVSLSFSFSFMKEGTRNLNPIPPTHKALKKKPSMQNYCHKKFIT
jgi:hypothetical protein